MTEEPFTDPDDTHEGWVDVRMTNPEAAEWDIDVVVVDGQVEYVDLRVRPNLLDEFVACLIDDVSDDRADAVLTNLVDRTSVDLDREPADT